MESALQLINSNTGLVSGYGQTHSDKFKPLLSVSYNDIRNLVDNPQKVDKAQAQWLIPSTIETRSWQEHEKGNSYWCLWADIDESPPPLEETEKALRSIIGNTQYELYTSRSATIHNQKCRILIFLNSSLLSMDWKLCQESLNDALQEKGIKPDRANEGYGQLCYLPNKGEYYKALNNRSGGYFAPLTAFNIRIENKIQAISDAEKAKNDRLEQSRVRREQRLSEGFKSPIDAFNSAYLVEDILLKAGYEYRCNHYRHPNSESGSYSASIKDGRVHTLSNNDPLYTTNNGAHDAFSAFTVLFHNGDEKAALKDACDNWLKINGLSWNENSQPAAQVESQQQKNRLSPLQFLLQSCANGESAKMKEQMLDDKYILKDLAIMGQWTVFYAAPNTGKTLLTFWMICESIKDGQINGKDIFYANCDDTFKGGTIKLEIAEKNGFNMLIPNIKGFKADTLLGIMVAMVENEEARGKIIILDTLKKFTDLMDKKQSSAFGSAARNFVGAGGSIICLAHVNKRKGEDGKSIHAGTSDINDDADCSYIIEQLNTHETQEKAIHSVSFENTKSRGDVVQSQAFQYTKQKGAGYEALLRSVTRLSEDDKREAETLQRLNEQRNNDNEIIQAIQQFVRSHELNKTDLAKKVCDDTGESQRKVKNVIKRWTGNYEQYGLWHTVKGEKNEQIYKLNLSIKPL